jgi:cell wall-associated NlpC family hydrolase
MRLNPKRAIVVLVLWGLPGLSPAQQLRKSASAFPISGTGEEPVNSGRASGRRTLTPDDGLAVIAAALDSRTHSDREPDCSHLVHAIYSRAGFPYIYAPSSDLYAGTHEFQRVSHPQAGDLVVWQGHAGIVVNPARHVFFSALNSGFGTDAYDAPYWKERGHLRFYRYIKGSYVSTRR